MPFKSTFGVTMNHVCIDHSTSNENSIVNTLTNKNDTDRFIGYRALSLVIKFDALMAHSNTSASSDGAVGENTCVDEEKEEKTKTTATTSPCVDDWQ